MKKEEYWIALIKKNPSFQGDNVKISTRSLKAIVFQAYDKGFEHKSNNAKMRENEVKNDSIDYLRGIFGIK